MVPAPFDTKKLDDLMDQAGIDIVLSTSKHNTYYLSGGVCQFAPGRLGAIGLSQFLPVFVYPKGAPDKAAYFGHRTEKHRLETLDFWISEVTASSWGTVDAMRHAAEYMRQRNLPSTRIGVERSFLPVDAADILAKENPGSSLVDVHAILESLRALKSPQEIDAIREASELVVESIAEVIQRSGPGTSKFELLEALREEQTKRGLEFEYGFIAMGNDHNRAPTHQRWRVGEVVSIDSVGSYKGYLGDLARMGILGDPDDELSELLAEVELVQKTAMQSVAPGVSGDEIYAAIEGIVARSPNRSYLDFVAHGIGLVAHEAPRLSARGPVPYSAPYAKRALEANMTLSIETSIRHHRGFIKLEDTVVVTQDGFDTFANVARGWNRAGAAGSPRL